MLSRLTVMKWALSEFGSKILSTGMVIFVKIIYLILLDFQTH